LKPMNSMLFRFAAGSV